MYTQSAKSRYDVVDKPLAMYPGVPELIHGFSQSDETLSCLHMTLAAKHKHIIEPRHEIPNNVVCATTKSLRSACT